jgi:hypothetical protein
MSTTTTETTTTEVVHPAIDALRQQIDAIGLGVLTGYTLADAMREGSTVTDQKVGGWVDSGSSCAIGAAFLAAKARGFVE